MVPDVALYCTLLPLLLPTKRFPPPSTKKPVPLSKAAGGEAPSAILPVLSLFITKVDASKSNVCDFISKAVPLNDI